MDLSIALYAHNETFELIVRPVQYTIVEASPLVVFRWGRNINARPQPCAPDQDLLGFEKRKLLSVESIV